MSTQLERLAMEKAAKWLEGDFDRQTKNEVRRMMENDTEELTESFYRDLEFGTGGLRGIMGVGTNRMNVYTVGMATQGLADYLKINFKGERVKVAVAHDCRNNSRTFAETVADIFAANGFQVYMFDALRPTPELSFTIRELGCHSGVMVTASHNPREYNGYKAYWTDGSQVTEPHDKNIIAEVAKITDIDQIKRGGDKANITVLDEKFDEKYLNEVHSLSLSPDAVKKHHDMKIVYTPLHGCGVRLVPASLAQYGFTNVSMVKEQAIVDGNFPTVDSPNPEERNTMAMAIEQGRREGAELVLATDPDSDRIGIAVPDETGEYVLLNGNQTCVLLTYYLLKRWSDLGRIHGRQYIIKTIVTTEMMARVADSFKVEHYNCLTGFKYIARIIRENEGKKQYIGGGEESFGYLAGDFVRDKDAVSACSLAAEAAAWAKSEGMSLWTLLKKMYTEYGFFKEGLVAVVLKGIEGADRIRKMMQDYRDTPPASICGSPVVTVRDYLKQRTLDVAGGKVSPIDIEKSDVLQFVTSDGTIVSVRPSGTEPKIKYYFGVCEPLPSIDKFDEVEAQLDDKILRMKKELKLV